MTEQKWPEPPLAGLTIMQRLVGIASEIGAISKGRHMEQGPERFSFRGYDDVINASHPLFNRWGVLPVPKDLSVTFEDVTRGKNQTIWRHYLVEIEWTFYGFDGDSIVTVSTGEGLDNSDKGLGKARSYSLKDLLSRMLTLPTDDPVHDNEAAHVPEREAEHRESPDDEARRLGYENAVDLKAMHDEIAGRIKTLPDTVDREPFKKHKAEHPWPLDSTAMSALMDLVEAAEGLTA